jgi:hypothetical protein
MDNDNLRRDIVRAGMVKNLVGVHPHKDVSVLSRSQTTQNIPSGRDDSLVKLTLPGYSNFSRSLSVVLIGGVPTCGGADDRDALTGNGFGGLAGKSSDGDRLCVADFGSSGDVALSLLKASSYT